MNLYLSGGFDLGNKLFFKSRDTAISRWWEFLLLKKLIMKKKNRNFMLMLNTYINYLLTPKKFLKIILFLV